MTVHLLRPQLRFAWPALYRGLAATSTAGARLSSNPFDPFPRPFDPPPVPSRPVDVFPTPAARSGEAPAKLRARLTYQARKRGSLESGLLLSTFARDFLPSMSVSEMRDFDKLLGEADSDIYTWATGKCDAPERWKESEVMAK